MRPHDISSTESSSIGSLPSAVVPQKRRLIRPARPTGRNGPTTFMIRSEEEMEQSISAAPKTPADSMYGVQSIESTQDLEDTTESTNDLTSVYDYDETAPLEPRIWEGSSSFRRASSEYSTSHHSSARSSPPQSPLGHLDATRLSCPLTPLFLRSPITGTSHASSSPPSTPKSVSIRSLQLSDDGSLPDEDVDQAMLSASEDDLVSSQEQSSQSAPQLVMPSISMPSRRPFTERGKKLGKLKILVAGGTGSGKSSLIRSIVRACEDIVHIDASSVPTSSMNSAKEPHSIQGPSLLSTQNITEIYASSRAYPSWWSELDESKTLRRRRSNNESILERNICFIDVPGYSHNAQPQAAIDKIVSHIEQLFWRNQSISSFSDAELLSMLSGNGGVQVDLVVFVLENNASDIDLDFMQRLSRLTNVLPVIGKCDLTPAEDIHELQESVHAQLQEHNVESVLLNATTSASSRTVARFGSSRAPYLVSSLLATDDENMDASLLMSSTYIQPLISSELSELVSHVFDPDTAAWLRHSSARKFLQWRRSIATSIPRNPTLGTTSPTQMHTSGVTSGTNSIIISPAFGRSEILEHMPSLAPSPYTLAAIADHTEREERLTQARLARWATDLQRSLANERERFAQLQRQERKTWLTERLNECDDEEKAAAEAIVPTAGFFTSGKGPAPWARKRSSFARSKSAAFLFDFRSILGDHGMLVVRVLGGCSIIGAFAVWVARGWGVGESTEQEWTQTWGRSWWGPMIDIMF